MSILPRVRSGAHWREARQLLGRRIDHVVDQARMFPTLLGADPDHVAAVEDQLAIFAAMRARAAHPPLRPPDAAIGAGRHQLAARFLRLPSGDDGIAVIVLGGRVMARPERLAEIGTPAEQAFEVLLLMLLGLQHPDLAKLVEIEIMALGGAERLNGAAIGKLVADDGLPAPANAVLAVRRFGRGLGARREAGAMAFHLDDARAVDHVRHRIVRLPPARHYAAPASGVACCDTERGAGLGSSKSQSTSRSSRSLLFAEAS
jgi:hypothetical protein